MKRALLLAFVAFIVGYTVAPRNAPASVTLTTPFSQAGPNVTAETDPYAAPMAICADQVTQIMTLKIYPATAQTINGGKVTGVTVGTIPPVEFTINAQTGAWSSTNGQAGTLTGSGLIGAQGWLASALTSTMKNQAEPWLISVGVMPGVQTPWQ
jgi:hypothetical protein